MLVVLPFCAKDGALAITNLKWIKELDPQLPFHCILSHDTETPPPMVEEMKELASSIFPNVSVNWYPAPQSKHWPAGANCAFQNAARYVAYYHPKDSWLFLEADATPIRSGWLSQLEAEHISGGKPFSGHVVDGMGHPNGVMIYPPDVSAYSQDAMRVAETAWDVVIGATVDKSLIHPVNQIIRHCWNMDEKTGECLNGHGISPTFRSMDEVVRKVDLQAALYHRCKDGSLIHWLRRFYKSPHEAMVPNHTGNEKAPQKPSRKKSGIAERTQKETEFPLGEFPKTEIFIVSYGLPTKRTTNLIVSDFDWLKWCLRCLRRYATGFTGITLAIPDRDAGAFQPMAVEHANSKTGMPLRIKLIHEKPGKGMLTHMAAIGSADEFVPKDTEFVLHVDSDCMANTPVTPAEYIKDGKPYYVVRTYESLTDATTKSVSDCLQWKTVAEANIGMPIEMYTMLRHPTCYPIDFYKKYREHVQSVHGMPFMDYVLSCKNSFPQTYAEFPAQGGYAYATMKDRFHWLDVSGGNHLAPKDKFMVYWSHAGLTPTVQAEIEQFLK